MCIYPPKELYPYHKLTGGLIVIFLALAVETSAASSTQLMHFHNKMLRLHLNLSFEFEIHNHGFSLGNLVLIFFCPNQAEWIFLTKGKVFFLTLNFLDWIAVQFLSRLFFSIQIFIPTYLFQSVLFLYLSDFLPLFLIEYSLYIRK